MAALEPTHPRADAATLSRLRALLRVAAVVRSQEDVGRLLQAVAETAAESLGFGAVVVNLRRPAWDDLEVVVVVDHSNPAVSDLLGEPGGLDQLSRLLDPRFDRGGAYFLPHEEFDTGTLDMAMELGTVHGDGDDGWHPEDMLVAPLIGADGDLLGFLSLDDPRDGRRPGDGLMETIAAVAAIMASVIEHAHLVAEAERHRAAVEHLLRVSSELAAPSSRGAMLRAVCEGVRDALGFEKVAVYLREAGPGKAAAAAAVGFDAPPPELDVASVLPLLEPARTREGWVLLGSDEARASLPAGFGDVYVSRRNGRGPRAWNRHWLVVPLVDRAGRTVGVLWADDPADSLLPSDDDLRALRAFANHAVTAIESAQALETMRHLAEHDPLTGLRNRRTFEPGIAYALRDQPVALLVLDLDRF
jgi:GAF domain-containing protein